MMALNAKMRRIEEHQAQNNVRKIYKEIYKDINCRNM